MTQSDVLNILEKKKEWLTNKQISKFVECNITGVRRATEVLYKCGEISRRITKQKRSNVKVFEHHCF